MAKGGEWRWRSGELSDSAGRSIAHVSADVLVLGSTRFLLERSTSSRKFRMRATSSSGAYGFIRQDGFTVKRLSAQCAERPYRLDRPSTFHRVREIRTAGAELVATVSSQFGGTVVVEPGPAFDDVPVADVAFLTWGCALIDAPPTPTRMGGRNS
ncbi:hypothetical protein [Corynebacterium tapiri]|uniref:Uncharacterized protein n=1 Tax=Corynebacterium tapiri TaxID=1448266 RepID=A0A5C4U2G4_9CORY|nr:hypothetical protein [Corynebacterium tapiri]TNL96581.1 hypothetical protein FHE74_07740 [Corynebacterium tapiri]